jgi:hypothetical protein
MAWRQYNQALAENQTMKRWLFFLIVLLPCLPLAAQSAGPSADPMQAEPGASALKELRSHLDYLGGIESQPLPDTVTPPPAGTFPEWPGMNRFDVIEGLRVLAQAQVVVVVSAQGIRQPVWIKTLRGYRKGNGWYGIRINGQEISEASLYLLYGGREINFQELMTWGSRQTPGAADFTTEP